MKHPSFKRDTSSLMFPQQWGTSLLLMVLTISLMTMAGCSKIQAPLERHVSKARPALPKEQQTAQHVYQEAWKLVLNDYVDPNHNGQNWYRWKERYTDRIKTKEDAYTATRTMLASLNDNYTRFLNPRKAKEQNMQIDSRLFGVGIQIAKKDNAITVVAPIENSPASRAGLQPQDVITHINGKPTANISLNEAAEKIRGPKGTAVTLTIKRDDTKHSFRLIRDEIKIKTVFGKPISDDIGYIRLSSFISQNAADEMADAIKQQQNTKALIVDLRSNYGGLLPNALEITDMFLGSAEIVSVKNRLGEKTLHKARRHVLYDKPLVLLIDGGTASASEILSGALKDHKRATLIGTRSFGKGLVQRINYLADGSELNLTIAKYYTPAGRDIDKKGIEPDIEIKLTEADIKADRDPQKDAAITFLKKRITAQTAQASNVSH